MPSLVSRNISDFSLLRTEDVRPPFFPFFGSPFFMVLGLLYFHHVSDGLGGPFLAPMLRSLRPEAKARVVSQLLSSVVPIFTSTEECSNVKVLTFENSQMALISPVFRSAEFNLGIVIIWGKKKFAVFPCIRPYTMYRTANCLPACGLNMNFKWRRSSTTY